MQYCYEQRITNRADVSQWSKAVYAYGVAALLVQLGGEANRAEGLKLMTEVPKLRQRIAGKSIPLEKFVARKARKYEVQGGRLLLPALELAYILHAVSRTPRSVIAEQMLPLVEAALVELKRYEGSPEKYGKGSEFWDDWCLARHLEGACLRYIAYPVSWDRQVYFFVIPSHHFMLFCVGSRCHRGSRRSRVDPSSGSCGTCQCRVPIRVRKWDQNRTRSLRCVFCT